jgi:hypothetical protein
LSREDRDGRTHRSNTDKRSAHASIETSSQTITSNTLAHNIDGGGVDASLSGLKSDLYEIKRVSHDDSAKTTEATGGECASLLGKSWWCAGLGFVLWLRSRRGVLELIGDAGLDGRVWGVGGGHCGEFREESVTEWRRREEQERRRGRV